MTISEIDRMTICRRTDEKIFNPFFSSLFCCPYLIFLQSSLSPSCVLFLSFCISDYVWWGKHIIRCAFSTSCESKHIVQKKEIWHYLDFFKDGRRILESVIFIVWCQSKNIASISRHRDQYFMDSQLFLMRDIVIEIYSIS